MPALEFVNIKDFAGASQAIAVDAMTGGNAEVVKLALGADGVDPTLLAPGAALLANTLPVNVTPNAAPTTTAVSVTTTAALLGTQATNRRRLMLFNNGTKTVFVGASGVTASTGWPIFPGTGFGFDIGPGVILHAVSADGTGQDCRVLEFA